MVRYNLACSYSLLNRVADARAAMVRAIELGYDEWDHMRRDPDLVNLMADRQFQIYLAKHQPDPNGWQALDWPVTGDKL